MTDQTNAGELIVYNGDDGRLRVQVRLADGSVWLSQRLIADLYGVSVKTVSEHLTGIYDDAEVDPDATVRSFRTVRTEGKRSVSRDVDHYALPAILAVGYRVRSTRGTQFRQWATARLADYVVKGFVLDDERLKQAGGGDYFDELLARIRDIRSSERVFYGKVLDIYATSIDYDPKADASQIFFKTVQNKIHFAAHGHTAAEIVAARADASKPNMGLTTWTGASPRKADVTVAKNYLDAPEIETLNRVVSAYLEFAELQAMNRRPMAMADWIQKLDEFLKVSDRDVLRNAGAVSHDAAVLKAEGEFAKFATERAALPAPVDRHFEEAVRATAGIEKARRIGARAPKRRRP